MVRELLRADVGFEFVGRLSESMPMVSFVSRDSRNTFSEVIAQIHEKLQSSGHAPLTKLRVHEEADGYRMVGEVPTFYLKQMAQVLATQVLMTQEGSSARLANETIVTKPGRRTVPAVI